MRLFKHILLLMLVASIIPMLLVGALAARNTRELLVRDAQELAQERVKQLRMRIERLLEEPLRAVTGLSRSGDFFALQTVEQRAQLAAILNQRREVAALTAFSRSGERVPGLQAVAIKDTTPTEIATHEAAAKKLLASARPTAFSEVYGERPRITLVVAMGEPPTGFIAAELSLDMLTELLATERFGSNGFAYVVDPSGNLVAASPAMRGVKVGLSQTARPAVGHLLSAPASKDGSIQVGNFGEREGRVVAAHTQLWGTGWFIVSEQRIELAYKQVRSMERDVLVSLGGAVLVALTLAWLFSRRITRPLKKLTPVALELARGNFGVQVKVDTKDEIGDLAQTFNYMSAQISANTQENMRLYESLEKGYLETIVALANSIDSKDPYTRGHSQRVADVSVEIGRELGLPERELKHLRYGGILHDIGKIGIIDAILCKQSRLTEQEMLVMRDHPAIGDTIVQAVSFLVPARAAVRNHHERWDGTGYPDALKGEAIPLIARIVNCADTFDACTSTRPYQKAMPLEKAMDILEKLRGTQIDPSVLDALRRVLEKRGVRVEGQRNLVKLAS